MPNKLVRVSLHLQRLKFGMQSDPTKPNTANQVDDMKLKQNVVQKDIQEVGIRLSYSENRALFAVLKLLDGTDYKGNAGKVPLTPEQQRYYSVPLPKLKIKIRDYLEAYGVKKKRSSRKKMEYNPKTRTASLNALKNISERDFLIVYERTTFDGKKKTINQIEYISSLINVKQDKGNLEITPSPFLVDQIDTHFCWLPCDLYDLAVKQDNIRIHFLEYINYVYDLVRKQRRKNDYTLSSGMKVWAKRFRMDAMVKKRQWKRIREQLKEQYEFGVKTGFLLSFDIDKPGVKVAKLDNLTMNIAKLSSMRSNT